MIDYNRFLVFRHFKHSPDEVTDYNRDLKKAKLRPKKGRLKETWSVHGTKDIRRKTLYNIVHPKGASVSVE